MPYSVLAAAYALDGKIDEAKSAMAEARRLNPKLTVKWMIERGTNDPSRLEGSRKSRSARGMTAPISPDRFGCNNALAQTI